MNLNQLHYFVTLAYMEHYTKAAKQLSITQPSLSHAIGMLEQELGTYLFEKQGRNVVLTKYGKVFLKYAEESLRVSDTSIHRGVNLYRSWLKIFWTRTKKKISNFTLTME